MSGEKLIDKNWVDIVPIQIVDEPDHVLLSMIALGLILSIFIFFYFYARQPTNVIKRQLNTLANQVKFQDNKLILLDLEKVLCNYFQVSQLSLISFNEISFTTALSIELSRAGSDSEQMWLEFKSQLHESCYSSSLPDNETTYKLIQQARQLSGRMRHV